MPCVCPQYVSFFQSLLEIIYFPLFLSRHDNYHHYHPGSRLHYVGRHHYIKDYTVQGSFLLERLA